MAPVKYRCASQIHLLNQIVSLDKMPTLQLQELLFKMQEHLTCTFLPIAFLLKRGSEENINALTSPESPLL